MSTASNLHNASGVAVASLVFGILTLMMIWLPILHLLPGVVAVALGIVAVQLARRRTAGGEQLAVVGMLFALIGMLPTITLSLALAMAGTRDAIQAYRQAALFKGGIVGVTLSITPWITDEAQVEDASGGVKARTLKSPRGYHVEAMTYHTDDDGHRTGIHGTYTAKPVTMSTSPSAPKGYSFAWESSQTNLVRYKGILQPQFSSGSVELKVSLENEVPCQLAVEGLRDAWATEWPSSKQIRDAVASDGNQAISLDPIPLDQPLPPGTHSIRIVGYVLSEVP